LINFSGDFHPGSLAYAPPFKTTRKCRAWFPQALEWHKILTGMVPGSK
jgi:hypothetical protein